MPTEKPGWYETRTRVSCFLPLNSLDERKALDQLIEYLEGLRTQPLGVDGFTHSAKIPPAFSGYWWDGEKKAWIAENVILLMVDYNLDISDEMMFNRIGDLKSTIAKWWAHFTGVPQQVIWVVAQPAYRYT